MDEETNELYEKIRIFLIDSIEILKKEIDINKIQTTEYYSIKIEGEKQKIVKEDSPNWYQLKKIPKKIMQLDSHTEAIQALKKHPIIIERQGKYAFAFGNGSQLIIANTPINFLTRVIAEEKQIEFNSDTYNRIFEHFINFIDPKREEYSRIIVPFDNFKITDNLVEIENGFRIRVLNNKELIDLINHNHVYLKHYYGSQFFPWFRCVLEIDLPFKWAWSDDLISKSIEQLLLRMYNPLTYPDIDREINQEIILLRTVYKYAITAPTYFIDYRGWNEGSMSMQVKILPWRRGPISFNDPVDIKKYQEYREKMHTIGKKGQQRIFVAMRKLAYSLDKIYPGDQLVDTISGLEGLVIEESEQEVSHKFVERVCLLLENDPEKRSELLTAMKKAYGLRSSVAHGTAVIDDFDLFHSGFKTPEKDERKHHKKFKDSQKLRNITRDKLQEAIFLCLDRQSTEFDWDKIIMGTTIKP